MRKTILFSLIFFCELAFGTQVYHFTLEPIDVVIPCIRKDLITLEKCIEGIREHGENIRRIIVVSSERFTDQAEWFDEKLYPFTKEDLSVRIFGDDEEASEAYLASSKCRIGWIYQQFLKLYASFVIPDISSNVLILDADTIFLQPVSFMNERGEGFFDVATEYHSPYFMHAKRLIPGFRRKFSGSGICHHMLFQRAILEDLFSTVEAKHGAPFWIAACRQIDHRYLFGSCLSEYEMYFHFVLSQTDQVKIRPLKHKDVTSLRLLDLYKKKHFDLISCHTR